MMISWTDFIGAVLGYKEKFNVRSILNEVYFVIHKYTYLEYNRTLGEYV